MAKEIDLSGIPDANTQKNEWDAAAAEVARESSLQKVQQVNSDVPKSGMSLEEAVDETLNSQKYSANNPIVSNTQQSQALVEDHGRELATISLIVVFIFVFFLVVRALYKAKNKLDTRLKRVFLILCIFGLIIFIKDFYAFLNQSRWREFPDVVDVIFGFWDQGYEYHEMGILFGFWVFITGLLMSWFYDIGIGRIVQWVRSAPKA